MYWNWWYSLVKLPWRVYLHLAYFLGSIAAFLVQTKLIEIFIMGFSHCGIAKLKTILIIFSATHCSVCIKKGNQQKTSQYAINPTKGSRKEAPIYSFTYTCTAGRDLNCAHYSSGQRKKLVNSLKLPNFFGRKNLWPSFLILIFPNYESFFLTLRLFF